MKDRRLRRVVFMDCLLEIFYWKALFALETGKEYAIKQQRHGAVFSKSVRVMFRSPVQCLRTCGVLQFIGVYLIVVK